MSLNISALRRHFPYLDHPSRQTPVYLDSAATTQKPRAVIEAMKTFMEQPTGNVHRGIHRETEIVSAAYEKARDRVRQFINAQHADEIIFTKNATEAINLAMNSWALHNLEDGDAIALSITEHHSNCVPWLQLMEQTGVRLIWIDIDEHGQLDEKQLSAALNNQHVKLFALTGQSNVLGTQFPIKDIITKAHAIDAKVFIDAAQLAAHAPIDVIDLDCDFLAFSGHKIYGPTGIGVLYASHMVQKNMHPFMGGGGMVKEVTREGFTPADAPATFEAGTPPIIEAIGLAAALDWQSQFNLKDRIAHDQSLMQTAINELSTIKNLNILCCRGMTRHAPTMHGCVSFTIEGIHPHDLTDILGQQGIALRAGHHCTEPLHRFLNIPASTRLSTGLYTTEEEIRTCIAAINNAIKILS